MIKMLLLKSMKTKPKFQKKISVTNRYYSMARTVSRMTQIYKLSIHDGTHNQTHAINFPGTKTILEVKRDVSDLTNIPVRNQLWSGWPSQLTDDVSC